EVLMREASDFMDGLSLHYYVHPGGFWDKGQAVDFSEQEWDVSMEKTLHMDELITKHSEIMDKYDPEKEIGIIIDEWGAWYDVDQEIIQVFWTKKKRLKKQLLPVQNLIFFITIVIRVKLLIIPKW